MEEDHRDESQKVCRRYFWLILQRNAHLPGGLLNLDPVEKLFSGRGGLGEGTAGNSRG